MLKGFVCSCRFCIIKKCTYNIYFQDSIQKWQFTGISLDWQSVLILQSATNKRQSFVLQRWNYISPVNKCEIFQIFNS